MYFLEGEGYGWRLFHCYVYVGLAVKTNYMIESEIVTLSLSLSLSPSTPSPSPQSQEVLTILCEEVE